MRRIITIDGPNASGKGSLARTLSGRLGWPVLDTGLMYRATGLAVTDQGVDPDDEAACLKVVERLSFTIDPPDRLLIGGRPADVRTLRSHEAGGAASRVSVHRGVRDHVHRLQREFAESGEVIIDGRDVGTVTVPDARCKFFLTASPEVRATRRVAELVRRDITADYEQILADVRDRDARDTNRLHDPLRPAPDALVVDTTGLTPDEVVAAAMRHIASKGLTAAG